MNKAFSLVELLIVVAILGILAAVVVPEYTNSSQRAKAAASRDNLRSLRNASQLYAAQHNDVPPGYPNGDETMIPGQFELIRQLLLPSNQTGQTNANGDPGYDLGPYLKSWPNNTFNDKWIVLMLDDAEAFPEQADGTYGYIYKPSSREIRIDDAGTDPDGIKIYDY
ncbi:MAG: type II secretion system protein [Planctomycetota bacterium]|jgi:general secretion pathway protein G